KEGRFEALACEINARITGATYPSVLAKRFKPHGGWLMRNLRVNKLSKGKELLWEMEKKGLLYKKNSSQGVLPINFNLNSSGKVIKGQFLFIASNTAECCNLLERTRNSLPLEWEYDRD
ncbi:MAG: hypothetical protein HQK84_03135, partial [Nitrospinae bacterium]|nr:hypothetical protein [Nitrospinota bacterium]